MPVQLIVTNNHRSYTSLMSKLKSDKKHTTQTKLIKQNISTTILTSTQRLEHTSIELQHEIHYLAEDVAPINKLSHGVCLLSIKAIVESIAVFTCLIIWLWFEYWRGKKLYCLAFKASR